VDIELVLDYLIQLRLKLNYVDKLKLLDKGHGKAFTCSLAKSEPETFMMLPKCHSANPPLLGLIEVYYVFAMHFVHSPSKGDQEYIMM
jgi:hypothetical protein